jgi:hypothetical protein
MLHRKFGYGELTGKGSRLRSILGDEGRRACIRAKLDPYYALLFGLTRDELHYIPDPKDVYGPDFPGGTSRVLEEKEEKLYGEYRTRRLVLEAFDCLAPDFASRPGEKSEFRSQKSE